MVNSPGHPVAGIPLLETKLYIPKWRHGLVSRPRLTERLDQGAERKLTLVSAPAGFGKSTLLAEWVAATPANEQPVAWVSLDQSDNDPALFWAYLITALQTLQSGVGLRALSLLHSPQPQPIESVLTSLINEIAAIHDDFALILDDYHVIDAQPVHSAIAFLLDHLPPQMHVVIASRSDPPLPLARLRGRGESTEVRAADLRFTPDEAAVFLKEVMGLDLSSGEVAALETRTEGWIAGLQLAALSMQGRDDVSGFITAFKGDDRYIVDYLVEEVLQHQPERVRSFLLQTSILDRLSGPLCDAVTDQEESKGLLEALDRGNLFVIPLDDKRQWYRYHHLFADVLQAHSMDEQPDRVPTLHRRASEWYEHNGLPADAIRHALAAEDFERAAGLVELAWHAVIRSFGQDATWLGWVRELPDELVQVRPVLSTGFGLTLLFRGDLEAGEGRLREAERWLETAADVGGRPKGMVVVDEEEFRSLPGTIASGRAFLAQAIGDVSGTEKYARQALDLLPEDSYFQRGFPAVILGLAYWSKGDLEAAYQSIADAMSNMRMVDIAFAISGTPVMAELRLGQGRLREALSTYEQGLRIAAEQGEPGLFGVAEVYLGLGGLLLEQNDLGSAISHVLRSEELNAQAGQDAYEYLSRVARARIKEVQGDLDGALELLKDAERVYTGGVVPNVRPVAALKTRVWLAQGRLAEAEGWVRERGLSVNDDLSYLREFEHITLARVLIAEYKSDRADLSIHEVMGLMDRLLKAAEDGGRTGSAIEILVLQALAHEAQGNIPPALAPLERALTLAEPEGYVRIFVDEGEAMRNLLRHAAAGGITGSYTGRLLSVFEKTAQLASATSRRPGTPELAEPLTEREAEILRVISVGMTNQEIADQFVISVATVKRHITNVYGKLGVSNRTQATARANDLNLL